MSEGPSAERARLRVLSAGPGATVQDRGRFGYLRYGVTPAGPMDWAAFQTANLALGNEEDAAAVEISVGGFKVICEGAPLWAAYAGGAFIWRRGEACAPSAGRLLLQPGETLTAQAGEAGAWTYLAIEGGVDAPIQMGSRATYVRSGMGGVEGRMLRQGDILAAIGKTPTEGEDFEALIEAPWLEKDSQPIRVVLGPQDDYFAAEGLAAFFSGEFRLTAAADRMAYRLNGPPIAHSRGYNIISDGIALGAIQVAGDGEPLILMADRQPTGGYPKLGHVIRADIGRFAQMRPGEACRFREASLAEARAALLMLEAEIAATRARLAPLARELTAQILLEANLIDGVVNALGTSSRDLIQKD